MTARASDERGFVLVTTIVSLLLMAMLGVAVLATVDVQSGESGRQPGRDAAYDLAETALSSTGFVLSRAWPTGPGTSPPWTQSATCADHRISGGVAPPPAGTSGIAADVQGLVAKAWEDRARATGATWSVHVCDDGASGGRRSTLWAEPGLDGLPYDANGAQVVQPAGSPSPVRARRLWVRAQATLRGQRRAVAGLVQVVERPVLPEGYGAVAGKLSFAAGTGTAIDALLRGPSAGRLVTSLTGRPDAGVVQGGRLGLRCGLLELCLTSAPATLSDLPVVANLGLLGDQVKQFGSPTAATPAALDRLRQQAQGSGRRFEVVRDRDPCLTGPPPGDGVVTFIEAVGDGDGTCTVTAPGSIGTLVVARGRVRVMGEGEVRGVLYAAAGQGARSEQIVGIDRGATVRGGVYVDGGGILGVGAPAFSSSALGTNLCDARALDVLTCRLLVPLLQATGANDLLTALLTGSCLGSGIFKVCLPSVGQDAVVTALLPQLEDDVPAVRADPAITGAVVGFGTSGTVQESFREVPPRPAG